MSSKDDPAVTELAAWLRSALAAWQALRPARAVPVD